MNAVLLVNKMKELIRPVVNEKRGLIRREEISRFVKELMEGKEGKRMAENSMKEKSCKSFDPVVEMWRNSTSN